MDSLGRVQNGVVLDELFKLNQNNVILVKLPFWTQRVRNDVVSVCQKEKEEEEEEEEEEKKMDLPSQRAPLESFAP